MCTNDINMLKFQIKEASDIIDKIMKDFNEINKPLDNLYQNDESVINARRSNTEAMLNMVHPYLTMKIICMEQLINIYESNSNG